MRKVIQIFLVVALIAGVAGAADESPIAGTWQGKMEDVPVVTLTVKDDHGKLSGTVISYKIISNGNGPQVAGKSSTDMIDPRLDGKIFSYQIKASNGDLLSYQMELTGKDEGEFKGKFTTTGGGEPPEIKMIREKEART